MKHKRIGIEAGGHAPDQPRAAIKTHRDWHIEGSPIGAEPAGARGELDLIDADAECQVDVVCSLPCAAVESKVPSGSEGNRAGQAHA